MSSDCLALENGTAWLSLNVGNYQPKLRNILEERRSQINLPGFVGKPSLFSAARTLESVRFILYIFC
jgi:hypothetical protein